MKIKRMVICALCAALYIVLANYVSIHTLSMKLTFDSLPILLCAVLFGPVDGLIVGALGNFLSQLLGPFGVTITTPLWMLPAMTRGLLTGLWAKHLNYKITWKNQLPINLVTAILSTLINTVVMWADAKVFGYPFAATLPTLLLRIAAGLITSVLFAFVLPPIVDALKKNKLA